MKWKEMILRPIVVALTLTAPLIYANEVDPRYHSMQPSIFNTFSFLMAACLVISLLTIAYKGGLAKYHNEVLPKLLKNKTVKKRTISSRMKIITFRGWHIAFALLYYVFVFRIPQNLQKIPLIEPYLIGYTVLMFAFILYFPLLIIMFSKVIYE